MKLINKIKLKINLPIVLIAFVVFVICQIAVNHAMFIVKDYAGGAPILDMRFGYSIQEVQQFLAQLGAEGRDYYYSKFFIYDLLFPLSCALFYCTILAFLFKKIAPQNNKLNMLLLLPLLSTTCDLSENIAIRSLIRQYPDLSSVTYNIANIFTVTKFIVVYIVIFTIALFTILYIVKKIRKK